MYSITKRGVMASRATSKEAETVSGAASGAQAHVGTVIAAAAALYVLRCLPAVLFPAGLASVLTLVAGFVLGVAAVIGAAVSSVRSSLQRCCHCCCRAVAAAKASNAVIAGA